MRFCSNCGNPLTEDACFCTQCGSACNTQTAEEPVKETVTEEPVEEPKHGLHVGFLVWSIINMVLTVTPLGVVGLVFTIMANDTPMTRALGYLKVVKTVNLVATIIGAVAYTLLWLYVVFVVVIFGILMGGIVPFML